MVRGWQDPEKSADPCGLLTRGLGRENLYKQHRWHLIRSRNSNLISHYPLFERKENHHSLKCMASLSLRCWSPSSFWAPSSQTQSPPLFSVEHTQPISRKNKRPLLHCAQVQGRANKSAHSSLTVKPQSSHGPPTFARVQNLFSLLCLHGHPHIRQYHRFLVPSHFR